MQNKPLNILLYLPIIFLFLPAFGFYVPYMHSVFIYFFPILYFCLFLVIISDPKKFILKIAQTIKCTPFKWLILMIILISIDSVYLSLTGITSFNTTIKSIIMQFGFNLLPIVLYFIYIIDKFISFEKFIVLYINFIDLQIL